MKLVLAIEYYSLKPLAFRFTLPSVTKISSPGVVLISIAFSFLFVSGIKEAYKGLLDGDILVGINSIYLADNEWTVVDITPDLVNLRIFDPDEQMTIMACIYPAIKGNSTSWLKVVIPNAVSDAKYFAD